MDEVVPVGLNRFQSRGKELHLLEDHVLTFVDGERVSLDLKTRENTFYSKRRWPQIIVVTKSR